MSKTIRITLNAVVISLSAYAMAASAAEPVYPNLPVHNAHEYTSFEKTILQNTAEFHKNFNERRWDKNGELVAKDIHVRSNGAELNGREAFVQRIQRFTKYFPDVAIKDISSYADGNTTIDRFVITGTHKVDLPTPNGVIPATNKKIKVEGVEIFTFDKEGKVKDLVTVERGDQLIAQITGKESVE